jgi:hypothetical protein
LKIWFVVVNSFSVVAQDEIDDDLQGLILTVFRDGLQVTQWEVVVGFVEYVVSHSTVGIQEAPYTAEIQ